MSNINLGGHSGCQIILMEKDNGSVFVRKISKDLEYNERLKLQCKKQASFKGIDIRTPYIYDSGYNESGLFYFDMEYIQGVTLAEYIKTMEIGKVRGLVYSIVKNLVPTEKKNLSLEKKIEIQKVFNNKFIDLRSVLKKNNNAIIEESLNLLEKHDWSSLEPSQCHGDLTLENIIVKNDSLYLIDFLDSFYDSWLLDIGTLLQDVQVMWSYRNSKDINMNTVLRLIVFRDLLIDCVSQYNNDYIIEMYYTLLQKLIRIFPYTKDKKTFDFLQEKTMNILNIIKKFEERKK